MRDGPGGPQGVRTKSHGCSRQGGAALKGAAALVLAGVAPAAASVQRPATPAPLVFDGVTVVDVEQGQLLPERRVVVTGNRIQAVGAASAVKLPDGAQVVDARGKYLIPGLWDIHVHPLHLATDVFYPLFVAYGVTGIRDAGSDVPLDTLIQWRREILAGRRVGPPRQVLSGPYFNNDKWCEGFAICPRDTADARHLVDSLKAAGADMIKLREADDLEVYFAAASEARRLGIRFGGHFPIVGMGQITVLDASDSGASVLEHAAAGTACWGRATTIDVERCQAMAERFRRNGTWWVPTLFIYRGAGRLSEAAYQRFGTQVHRLWGDSADPDTSVPSQREASVLVDSLRTGDLVQRLGLPILAGTDASAFDYSTLRTMAPGLSLHGELALLAAEGITPLTTLQAATLNPARMLGATDSLGTVAAGKLADLVLLDADPLADITNTTAIRAVVANGRYFDRAALDRLLTAVRGYVQATLGLGPEP